MKTAFRTKAQKGNNDDKNHFDWDSVVVPEGYKPGLRKQKLNNTDLAFFREMLKTMITDNNAEVKRAREGTIISDTGPDDIERANIRNEAHTANSQLSRLQLKGNDLNTALEKIESAATPGDSEFGYCEITDEFIGVNRLLQLPHARCTVEQQKVLERRAGMKAGNGLRGRHY